MAGVIELQQVVASLRDDIAQLRCELKKEREDRCGENMALLSSVQAINSTFQNDQFERARKNAVVDEFMQSTNHFMQHVRQSMRSEEDQRKKQDIELLTAIKSLNEIVGQEALERMRKHSQIDEVLGQAGFPHAKRVFEKDGQEILSAIQVVNDSAFERTTQVDDIETDHIKDGMTPQSLASYGRARDDLISSVSDIQEASTIAGQSSRYHQDMQIVPRVISEEITEGLKKVMAALESEKSERKSSYGLLQSHLGNFQYDMAVERNERNQLQSEILGLKAEVKARKGSSSQQATPRLEHLADDAEGGRSGKELTGQLDKLIDEVKREVAVAFQEYQHRHKELKDLCTTLCTQEKLTRDNQIGMLQQNLERLENLMGNNDDLNSLPGGLLRSNSRNLSHTDSNILIGFQDEKLDTLLRHDQQLRALECQDLVARQELDVETRRLWEVIDRDIVSRGEFESNAQRLWEAIMQLQAKQLEDIKKQTRDEAQSVASVSTGFTAPDRMSQSGKGKAGLSASTSGGSAAYPNPSGPGNQLGQTNSAAAMPCMPSLAGSLQGPERQASMQGPPQAQLSSLSGNLSGSLSGNLSGNLQGPPQASMQGAPQAQGAPVMPSFSGSTSPPTCANHGPQSARNSLGHGGAASPRNSIGPQPHPSPLSRTRPGNTSPFQPSLSKPSFAKVGSVGSVGPVRSPTAPSIFNESMSTLGTKSQETVRVEVSTAQLPQVSTAQLPQHPPVVSPRIAPRPDIASPRVSLRSPMITPRTIQKHEKSYTYSC